MSIASILAPALILVGSFSFGKGTHSLFDEVVIPGESRGEIVGSLYNISLTGLGLANFGLGILIGLQGFLSSFQI